MKGGKLFVDLAAISLFPIFCQGLDAGIRRCFIHLLSRAAHVQGLLGTVERCHGPLKGGSLRYLNIC